MSGAAGAHAAKNGADGRIVHIPLAQRQQRLAAVGPDAAVLDMHSAKLIADDLQPAAPVGSLIRPVLPIPCTEQVDRVKN